MSATNFIQWDPGNTNSQNDADYTASVLRQNGATQNATLPHMTDNKFRYQASTWFTAMANMLVNKGFSTSDASLATLTSVLACIQTTADVAELIQLVAFASSITFDAGVSPGFDLTLAGNVTSSSLINRRPGLVLTFIIQQDATGGRTFSWPSNITIHGTIGSAASSVSIQQFIVREDGSTIEPLPGGMLVILASGATVQQGNRPQVFPISSNGNVAPDYLYVEENVDASGGAITRNIFTAVGAAGQQITIKKVDSSVNAVTLVPNGSETIDGFSSYAVSQTNGAITLMSDGANWRVMSVIRIPQKKSQTFTSSGTFTPSTGLIQAGGSVDVFLVGGGGGGSNTGGGGGGGQVVQTTLSVNAPVTVTIGAGGAAQLNGGTTLFGATAAAGGSGSSNFDGGASGGGISGGAQHLGLVSSNAGGGGGASTAGYPAIFAPAPPPSYASTPVCGNGGGGINGYDGGGGGAVQNGGGGCGAGSSGGGNGGFVTGSNGLANTGGGGGGAGGGTGGSGGSGIVIVTW